MSLSAASGSALPTLPLIPSPPHLPACRVFLSDGTSYVTSMAAGVTLEQARECFVGMQSYADPPKPFHASSPTSTPNPSTQTQSPMFKNPIHPGNPNEPINLERLPFNVFRLADTAEAAKTGIDAGSAVIALASDSGTGFDVYYEGNRNGAENLQTAETK